MWLQRIIFNLKARLLDQTKDTMYTPAPAPASVTVAETARARVIQSRLLEMDQRLVHLQPR